MNEPSPSELQLRLQCKIEQFCPRCSEALAPRRSVMIEILLPQVGLGDRVVSRKVCCGNCYNVAIQPILVTAQYFVTGKIVVTDGRDLPAEGPRRSCDSTPTTDPVEGAG